MENFSKKETQIVFSVKKFKDFLLYIMEENVIVNINFVPTLCNT